MSSFPILDLVIGMIFIYFLLSIICSSAVELWFSILNTRAKLLAQWLTQIFDSPALDSNGKPVLVLDKDGKPKAAVGADKKPKLAVDKNGQKIASLDQNGNQLKDQNGNPLAIRKIIIQ